MCRLEQMPEGITQIVNVYGMPGLVQAGRFVPDADWAQENLRRFPLSFPLRQSWAPYTEIRSFPAHRLVGAAMVDALEEIRAIYGLAELARHGLNYWGGVYNPRLKTGSAEPSLHAWAVAIDYLPGLAPYGEPPRLPWHMVEAFTQRGFEWGGLWETPDGHHFQAARGY